MLSPSIRSRLAETLPADTPPFAFAFSGGGDSLSLLRYVSDHPSLRAVLHVDHGLREESSAEADQAVHQAAQLGHEAIVLSWNPEVPPQTAVQEKARRARYQLMGDYCRNRGVSALVTAHHADDQAETVLMRLDRATGWRGAAGMHPVRCGAVWPELAAINLLRPALTIARTDLRAALDDLTPINDPSNLDRRYHRIRARRYLQDRSDLTADMLGLSVDMQLGLRHERAHFRQQLQNYHLTHEGLLRIPRRVDASTLAALAPIIGGQEGPPERARIRARLSALGMQRPVSIGHGTIALWDGVTLTLSRDPVAMTGRRDGSLAPTAKQARIGPQPIVWDGRFMLRGEGGIIQPERRGLHVGYRVFYSRQVRVDNLVDQRLQALLYGPQTLMADPP